jgi:hypothetical protein
VQFFISAATEHLRHQQSHERRGVSRFSGLRERRGGWRIKFGWIDAQRPSELLQHRDARRYCNAFNRPEMTDGEPSAIGRLLLRHVAGMATPPVPNAAVMQVCYQRQ